MIPIQGGFRCSRPFYEHMADGRLFDWMACPYTIGGLGLSGLGMFILATGFIGLKNWSESWTLPMTWLAIMTPATAATLLPGSLVRRIAGLLTLAVAGFLIGLYFWWGRT